MPERTIPPGMTIPTPATWSSDKIANNHIDDAADNCCGNPRSVGRSEIGNFIEHEPCRDQAAADIYSDDCVRRRRRNCGQKPESP